MQVLNLATPTLALPRKWGREFSCGSWRRIISKTSRIKIIEVFYECRPAPRKSTMDLQQTA
jgi:hypothetical protein